MQENKLYLVFEFLSMDLKRYMDTIPSGEYMDKMLVKVHLTHRLHVVPLIQTEYYVSMLFRRFVSLRVACVKSYHARPKVLMLTQGRRVIRDFNPLHTKEA